jgi:hypothetical protein
MTPPPLNEKAWLKQTMEQSILISLQTQVKPDDLLDEQWLDFKNKIKDGDEIWCFRTPTETWTKFFPRCGLEGYALVRVNILVAHIFTSMS